MPRAKAKKSKSLKDHVAELHQFFVDKYGRCTESHMRAALQVRFKYSDTPEMMQSGMNLWKRKYAASGEKPARKPRRRRNRTA